MPRRHVIDLDGGDIETIVIDIPNNVIEIYDEGPPDDEDVDKRTASTVLIQGFLSKEKRIELIKALGGIPNPESHD